MIIICILVSRSFVGSIPAKVIMYVFFFSLFLQTLEQANRNGNDVYFALMKTTDLLINLYNKKVKERQVNNNVKQNSASLIWKSKTSSLITN